VVRRHAGFSLLELMISMAIMAVVVVYVTQSFSTQERTYVMVDQVTEAQQSLRSISDLIEREVRVAGFLVDEAGAACGIDATNGPDTLFVSNSEALDPSSAIQADFGARLAVGSGPAAGTTTLDLTFGDSVVLDGQPAYDTDGDNVADSDFQVNGGAIVYDRNDPTRGAACGIVTGVPSNDEIRVDFLSWTLGGVGVGSELVVVPAHVYQVNAQNQLLRDGMVLSEDVEDLQVAWFIDDDEDGVVDANEMAGAAGQPQFDPSGTDLRNLRELRVNFVVRTRGSDPAFTQGEFQATENRVAPAPGPQDDQTRRRVHSTTVRVRNVGNRGLMG